MLVISHHLYVNCYLMYRWITHKTAECTIIIYFLPFLLVIFFFFFFLDTVVSTKSDSDVMFCLQL